MTRPQGPFRARDFMVTDPWVPPPVTVELTTEAVFAQVALINRMFDQ